MMQINALPKIGTFHGNPEQMKSVINDNKNGQYKSFPIFSKKFKENPVSIRVFEERGISKKFRKKETTLGKLAKITESSPNLLAQCIIF